ncbi:hypothetical protein ACXFAU_16675 [Paenibacillus glucanolyticus]|uniref:hypothetical protein n=1 Tax=Paenibacillus TaxID=44249 RepID=UPI002474FF0D|nr:hypothetical protein [Paenibacillus sp. LBL]
MTIGKEYPVLSIEFYNSEVSSFSNTIGDFVIYRLRGDDGVILPYPSKLFEVVSNKMASRWIPYKRNDDNFVLVPISWAREYFWDDFYNDENDALLDLIKEEKIIIQES